MADITALLDGFSARLEAVEKALKISGGAGAPAGAAAAADDEVPASITAFDETFNQTLAAFSAACDAIGGEDAGTLKQLVTSAWAAQRKFLVVAANCKKPADRLALLKSCGVVDACQAAGKAVKRGAFEFHYKAVSEAANCLNWLMVEPKPREIIDAQLEAAEYNSNKIRLEFKRNTEKFNANQHAFCDNLKKLLVDLTPYTKAHHLTGVTWNFKGGDPMTFNAGAAAAATAPAAAAPAAPAAPAAAAAAAEGARPAHPLAAGISDLKGELKEDNATAGLKKVTKDMQTWRAEFKGGEPPKIEPKAAPRAVVVKTKGTKQCTFQNQGLRWNVEAQTKDDGLVEIEADNVKHSIAIYGCFGATISVKGKCKCVTVDSCEQTSVLVDSAISSVEVVNSKRITITIRGEVPTVAIDKTDGCLTHLSAASIGTTFTTAKSSEMNVSFPDPKSAEGELIEVPIPEQFVHKVILTEGKLPKMSADISDLYSH